MVKRFTRSEIIERLQETQAEKTAIWLPAAERESSPSVRPLPGRILSLYRLHQQIQTNGFTHQHGKRNPNEEMIKLLPELTNVVKDTIIA